MSDETHRVTGTFMTRDQGVDTQSGRPGHRLVMVYGVLSVPEGALKGEHQYVTVGDSHEGVMMLSLLTERGIDRSNLSIGNSPSGMYYEPIWSV